MVVRIKQRVTDAALAKLGADFGDMLIDDGFVQCGPLPEEANEPDIAHYHRIVFHPHRRNFGRMRLLLDAINAAELA